MTTDQALSRLQQLCSRAEKCTADLQKKLLDWEIAPAEARKIIAALQADGFSDDLRYARAFARDKSRLSRWGLVKIRRALKIKHINDAVIQEALAEIDNLSLHDNLVHLLQLKLKSLKPAPPAEQKVKLLRFALSRGYSYEEALDVLSALLKS